MRTNVVVNGPLRNSFRSAVVTFRFFRTNFRTNTFPALRPSSCLRPVVRNAWSWGSCIMATLFRTLSNNVKFVCGKKFRPQPNPAIALVTSTVKLVHPHESTPFSSALPDIPDHLFGLHSPGGECLLCTVVQLTLFVSPSRLANNVR